MSELHLAFYGDDFTGSADVMEVMQWSGLRTVLFLSAPTADQLASFEGLRAFGVAGWSRSMSPQEMEAELRPALAGLKESGARVIHYKTCSTFDSSPEIGSIGKAIELGREVVGTKCVPVVVGAPNLGRYQVFGNLFARSGLDTEPFRLDRHPTMRQHPITPMVEADLRVHLAEQSSTPVSLLDVLQLRKSESESLAATPDGALLIDVLDEDDLPRVGKILDAIADESQQSYFVGSSGIQYALAAHWAKSGKLEKLQSHEPGQPRFGPTDQLVAITGSCSPVNARQIAWAEEHGFETLALNVAKLIGPEASESEIEQSVRRAVERLRLGKNVILHSSRGPDDPRVNEAKKAFAAQGLDEQQIRLHSGRLLGPKLGQILARVLAAYPMPRFGVAGGDTSGYVAREMGIDALEALAPVAPGSPLCRVHAQNELNGTEAFFKGGQVGKDDVWGTMLEGTSS